MWECRDNRHTDTKVLQNKSSGNLSSDFIYHHLAHLKLSLSCCFIQFKCNTERPITERRVWYVHFISSPACPCRQFKSLAKLAGYCSVSTQNCSITRQSYKHQKLALTYSHTLKYSSLSNTSVRLQSTNTTCAQS